MRPEYLAQGGDEFEQFRAEDRAFGDIDEAVRAFGVEADPDLPFGPGCPHGSAPPAVGGRDMDRHYLCWNDSGALQRVQDPIAREFGDQRVGDMLKLAAAACAEMAAGGLLVVWPGEDGAIFVHAIAGNGAGNVASVCGDTVSASGKSNDCGYFRHFIHVAARLRITWRGR